MATEGVIVQLKDRNDSTVLQYPVTMPAAVIDDEGTGLDTTLANMTAVTALKANIASLDISYNSSTRVITLSHGGVALGTVNCNDFIIASSLTSAEYVTEGAQGEEGEFLKLTFGTDDVVYIDLEPLVDGALDNLVSRITALEARDVWLTEDEYEIMREAGTLDPNKVYHTYEEE